MRDVGPVVAVSIELDSPLERLASAAARVGFTKRVEEDIGDLLAQFGLDGRAAASVTVRPADRLIRIRLQGKLLPYPPRLLRQLWLVRAPRRLREVAALEPGTSRSGFPDDWLRSYLEAVRSDDYPAVALALKFLRSLVAALVRDRPASILPWDGGSSRLGLAWDGLDDVRLSVVLATLLDLGMGALPMPLLRRLVEETAVMTLEDAAEICFAQMRPTRLEIRLHPDYIEAMNDGEPIFKPTDFYDQHIDQSLRGQMVALEGRLFAEVGVRLPAPVLVPDPDSDQGVIALRVNGLDGIPIRGLEQGTVFVPLPHADLAQMGVHGTPALDPAGRNFGTEVREQDREILRGPAFLDLRGFFFEALYAELRRQAYRLICVEDVRGRLGSLAEAFPELAAQLGLQGISPELLTRILRALLREGISIRDLRSIAERLVDFETIPMPPLGCDVIDDRIPCPSEATPGWPAYLAFVRTGLKRQLSHQYGRQGRLRAYVLDSKLESQFDRSDTAPGFADPLAMDPEKESLRDKLWTRISAGTAEPDLILTSTSARLAVRETIASEFPDLPVLAAGELRPDLLVNVDRVATIDTR